jgi:hypothetical protein
VLSVCLRPCRNPPLTKNAPSLKVQTRAAVPKPKVGGSSPLGTANHHNGLGVGSFARDGARISGGINNCRRADSGGRMRPDSRQVTPEVGAGRERKFTVRARPYDRTASVTCGLVGKV